MLDSLINQPSDKLQGDKVADKVDDLTDTQRDLQEFIDVEN